jgi:RNA polymerase sigma factor (sigma-70 family)
MSHFDPPNPPTRSETTCHGERREASQATIQMVTTSGVTVTVRPPQRGELGLPSEPPKPPEKFPRVVIRPPEPSAEEQIALKREHNALMRRLFKEHGQWIQERLLQLIGKKIAKESTKDLRQRVLLVLSNRVARREEPLEHPRGFLIRVIRNVLNNHKRRGKLSIDSEADAEEELWSAPDPEEALALLERWRRASRYMTRLSESEGDVIRCVDLDELTIAETAEVLELPPGTVSTTLTRARKKLEAFALESDRAAERGVRLGPGG